MLDAHGVAILVWAILWIPLAWKKHPHIFKPLYSGFPGISSQIELWKYVEKIKMNNSNKHIPFGV